MEGIKSKILKFFVISNAKFPLFHNFALIPKYLLIFIKRLPTFRKLTALPLQFNCEVIPQFHDFALTPKFFLHFFDSL